MHWAPATAKRPFGLVVLAVGLCIELTAKTQALPPAAAAASALAPEPWLEHRVAPGERIAEIGDYYGVGSDQIIAWNKLDKDRPMIRTGQMLRIQTSAPSQSRVRASYTVRRGDSWATLAKRFEVTIARLRDQWNDGEEALQFGARIVVFRIPEPEPVAPVAPVALAKAAPVPTPASTTIVTPSATPATVVKPPVQVASVILTMTDAQSVGKADRGRIANAVQIPVNPGLYTLRNPEHSWGSSHAIDQLTLAIQRFRATGFDREVVIQDMSREGGGRFRPHKSHQSGRDVDIRLPLKAGLADGTVPTALSQVDWDATWAFMRALLSTGEVRFMFLSRTRQKSLYEAALRAGESPDELAALLQYPHRAKTTVIRHSRGHDKHFHVRFKCGPDEHKCVDPGFEADEP